jgi:hypothetical protein
MLLDDSCAGDPLNNSSKKKARRTGPKVIVDNETIIKKDVYMTWLDDPSSIVSKRRRVGEYQEDTGQLKLAHRLKKAQEAIVKQLTLHKQLLPVKQLTLQRTTPCQL